ncbi:MAG: FHA domain-containing protein [Planctomycetaceae bacterium]|nr:FHA domain-containing protein [Planctomycetaceae bacterium]
MGTFHVLRGKDRRSLAGTTLTIGSKGTADLVLDDPVVAAHHARLVFEGGRLRIEGLSTSSGTFVNGAEVTASRWLETNDRIVLGASRIAVRSLDGARGEVELELGERTFFFVPKERAQFQNDTDEWVRSEVRFGRWPALRRANLVVLGLVIALLVWTQFTQSGERQLAPGHLSDAHAFLLGGDDAALALAAARSGLPLAALHAGRELGCAACHGESPGAMDQNCAACHTDLGMSSVGATSPDPGIAARHPFRSSPEISCVACHGEHGRGLYGPAPDGPVACQDCHGDQFPSSEEGYLRAASTWGLAEEATARPRGVSAGFESFQHGAHRELSCQTCHTPSTDGLVDFSAPSAEQCIACHSAGGPGAGSLLVNVVHHGSKEGRCETCHAETYQPALATTSVLASRPGDLRFDVPGNPHHDVADARLSGRACVDCHLAGVAGPDERRERAFTHVSHVRTLSPATDAERELADAECRACHGDMQTSRELVAAPAVYEGPDPAHCTTCHRGGGAPVRVAAEAARAAPAIDAVRFDHGAHRDVEGGCFACHAFDGEASGSGAPTLLASATCRSCHIEESGGGLAHRGLGEDPASCNACHQPEGTGRLAAVFYGDLDAGSAATPSPLVRFSHSTPGHASANCADCHGSLGDAAAEVVVPTSTGQSCRECHTTTRFHWR